MARRHALRLEPGAASPPKVAPTKPRHPSWQPDTSFGVGLRFMASSSWPCGSGGCGTGACGSLECGTGDCGILACGTLDCGTGCCGGSLGLRLMGVAAHGACGSCACNRWAAAGASPRVV